MNKSSNTPNNKDKIIELVKDIEGKSYHQGTFADIAHKYPDTFAKMSKDIAKTYKALYVLLNKN